MESDRTHKSGPPLTLWVPLGRLQVYISSCLRGQSPTCRTQDKDAGTAPARFLLSGGTARNPGLGPLGLSPSLQCAQHPPPRKERQACPNPPTFSRLTCRGREHNTAPRKAGQAGWVFTAPRTGPDRTGRGAEGGTLLAGQALS